MVASPANHPHLEESIDMRKLLVTSVLLAASAALAVAATATGAGGATVAGQTRRGSDPAGEGSGRRQDRPAGEAHAHSQAPVSAAAASLYQ